MRTTEVANMGIASADRVGDLAVLLRAIATAAPTDRAERVGALIGRLHATGLVSQWAKSILLRDGVDATHGDAAVVAAGALTEWMLAVTEPELDEIDTPTARMVGVVRAALRASQGRTAPSVESSVAPVMRRRRRAAMVVDFATRAAVAPISQERLVREANQMASVADRGSLASVQITAADLEDAVGATPGDRALTSVVELRSYSAARTWASAWARARSSAASRAV